MLELLEAADYVLDKCGRPQPPPGYRFVDLPYFIPLKATFTPGGPTPFQIRGKNNSLTEFRVRGIVFECNVPIRVKWPNGRYLSQGPSFLNSAGSPIGTGGSMLALNEEVVLASGANLTVEVSS